MELDTVSFEQREKAAGLGGCQSRGLSPPEGGRGSCLDSGGQEWCLQLRASRTEPSTATHRLPPGTHCLIAADAQSRPSQGRRQPQPPTEASFLPPGLVRPRLGPQPRQRSRRSSCCRLSPQLKATRATLPTLQIQPWTPRGAVGCSHSPKAASWFPQAQPPWLLAALGRYQAGIGQVPGKRCRNVTLSRQSQEWLPGPCREIQPHSPARHCVTLTLIPGSPHEVFPQWMAVEPCPGCDPPAPSTGAGLGLGRPWANLCP